MGICTDCKHHVYTRTDLGRKPRCGRMAPPPPSGHWCTNGKKQGKDFVTGETFTPDCYRLNAFGECLDFERKEDEEQQEDTPEDTEPGKTTEPEDTPEKETEGNTEEGGD